MSLRTLHLRWSARIVVAVVLAAVVGGALAKITAEGALSETDEELGKAIARSVARRCAEGIAGGREDGVRACLSGLWEEDRVADISVETLDGRRLGGVHFRRDHPADRRIKYPVPNAGGPSEALVVVTLTGVSIERARAAVLRDTITSAAVFAGLAIVASLIATSRVVRPLRRLADAETRIAAGDLSVRVPEDSARELDELVHSFNQMVEALKKLQETKEQLTAMVVHDLRDPLSSTVLAIEAVDKDRLEGEDQELLAGASRRGRELLARMQELLDVARLEAGRLPVRAEATCLASLARKVAGDLGPLAAERGTRIEVVAPDSFEVAADESLLSRALGNLVSNALRFSPKGGLVEVRLAREDGHARFDVDDAGPGVPAAHRTRIFEPFARLEEKRAAGAGLGLAFVALVARGHGGSVEVGDSPAGGARFTLSIPAG